MIKNHLEKSMSFGEYARLIDDLLAEGKTTGPVQSEKMTHYARLNRQRMRRLEKMVSLNGSLKEKARAFGRPMIWLIITEGWCGDAAQNIPAIEKIAAESPQIETRYLLRDENLALMDQYLTNGTRSIPKLIALEAETLEVLGTWGARPAPAQELFDRLKAEGVEKPQILEELQRWYFRDKERSLQAEFETLLDAWAQKAKTLGAGK